MADTTSITHVTGAGTTEAQYLLPAHHSVLLGVPIVISSSDATNISKSTARATNGSVCAGDATDMTTLNAVIAA